MLTFFGFMHGEAIGIAVTPTVAIAYLIVAVFFFGLSRVAGERTRPLGAARGDARWGVGRNARGMSNTGRRPRFVS